MKTKQQFITILYQYLSQKEWDILTNMTLLETYKTAYLKLISDIKEIVQNEILMDSRGKNEN